MIIVPIGSCCEITYKLENLELWNNKINELGTL